MGDLRRRARSIRRYGPSFSFIFLIGVWPRAGLAETPPEPAPDKTLPAAEIRDKQNNLKSLPKPLDAPETLGASDEASQLERDQQAAEHHALDQLLPRNRAHDRVLARSKERLQENDCETAIELLQSILDSPDDSFTRDTGSITTAPSDRSTDGRHAEPRSIRRTVEQLLSDSPEALKLYQRMHDALAASLLQDARAGDRQAARELLTRFRMTKQAASYTLQRASILFDAGQTAEAQLTLETVVTHPALTQQQWRRISTLLANLPRNETETETETDPEVGPIQLVSTLATNWPLPKTIQHRTTQHCNAQHRQPLPSSSWCGPTANINGCSSLASIGPVLSPTWTLRHDECLTGLGDSKTGDSETGESETGESETSDNNHVLRAVRRWEAEQLDRTSDVGPIGPQSPIIHNSTLIYRDYEGIVARRINDGSLVWRVESEGSIHASLERSEDAGERGLLEARLTIDSVTGELTADAERVYWVERTVDDEGQLGSHVVALRLSNGDRLWTHRPQQQTNLSRHTSPQPNESTIGTTGHILSVPVPTAHGLLTIVEVHGRLELRSLNAQSGRASWTQPIAVADVPADDDKLRMLMSCRPVVADGHIVCGTQLGTLVAIDIQTGSLRWIYNYADITAGRGGRPRSVASREFNSRAFPNQPQICDGVVYAMPIQSGDIVAVSLATGQPLWTVQRDNDVTITLVDAARQQVVVTGTRFVRALSTTDGTERWRSRVPTVVGRGIGIGDELLLPTASGQLLRVDLADGAVVDDRWDRAIRLPSETESAVAGNIAIAQDYVVRTGPVSISVLPRSEMVAQRARRMLESGNDFEIVRAKVDLARVALASANPGEALASLSSVDADHLEPSARDNFEHLLRETLFATLPNESTHPTKPNAAFQQLHALAKTPRQAARVMKHRIENALRSDQLHDAVAVAKQLASLTNGSQPGTYRKGQLNIDAATLAGAMLQQLSATDLEDLGVIEEATRLAHIDRSTGRPDMSEQTVLERTEFLQLFGRRPEAGFVRLAHAISLLEAGQTQAAELQFLMAVRDGDAEAKVQARLALAGLYTRLALPREAAAVWEQLLEESRDHYFGGVTVGDLADHIPEQHPVAKVLRQRQPFPIADYAGSIAFHNHDQRDWSPWYSTAQPKMSPYPRAGIDVLDAGKSTETPSMSRLLLVDQTNARVRGSVEVPAYYWHPPSRIHRRAGHFMPIGFYDPVGVSLLEGRQLWSADKQSNPSSSQGDKATAQRPMVAVRNRSKVKIGPVNPDACVMQQRNKLFAVDPLTGNLLWSRTDLDRSCGMWFDESAGIVGDAEQTTVFDSDGIGYQIFSTATGERLSRGRLAPRGTHVRRFRIAGSRRVMYIARVQKEYRFRIWDSADPQADLQHDIVAGPTLLVDQAASGRVGLVDQHNQFHFLDLESGRTVLTCQLPKVDWEHAAGLNVFEQDGTVFVDIALSNSPMASQLPLSTTSVRIPSRSIGGNLTAIRADQHGVGEIVWTANLGRSTVLTGEEYRLPVLLVMARVRPSNGGVEKMKLTLLRTQDGEQLAQHEEIPRTPLWRWNYDIDNRRVELFGPETTVTVRFGGIADVVQNTTSPPAPTSPNHKIAHQDRRQERRL